MSSYADGTLKASHANQWKYEVRYEEVQGVIRHDPIRRSIGGNAPYTCTQDEHFLSSHRKCQIQFKFKKFCWLFGPLITKSDSVEGFRHLPLLRVRRSFKLTVACSRYLNIFETVACIYSLQIPRIIPKMGIPCDKYQEDWKSRLRRVFQSFFK